MKKTVSLFICMFSGMTLFAQPSGKFTGSVLWEISGKDFREPSYILGTYHLFGKDYADSISGLRRVMGVTGQTVGELVMLNMQGMQAQMMKAGMMPEGESYAEMLSAEDYEKLDKGLSELTGTGLDKLGVYQPGMINAMMSVLLYIKANPGFNPVLLEPIDTYMQVAAKEGGKPVLGLEGIEDQIEALFNYAPLKEQAEELVKYIVNVDYLTESLILMTQNYRESKLDKLYSEAFCNPDNPCPPSEAQKNAMLKNRNDRWLDRLPGIMKDKPSLIVVGALHLAGEEGLLFRLDKMGYKVTPVKE